MVGWAAIITAVYEMSSGSQSGKDSELNLNPGLGEMHARCLSPGRSSPCCDLTACFFGNEHSADSPRALFLVHFVFSSPCVVLKGNSDYYAQQGMALQVIRPQQTFAQ